MSLRDFLKDKLQEEKLMLLPNGFELVGDIAIINLPSSLDNEKYLIAQALVSHSKNVKVVLLRKNKRSGQRRIALFEILLGDRTTTVHRENGCFFHVDIAKTYFSGKMYFERNRINITGLDDNPAACALFKKNAELNHIDADIILGDANSMCSIFKKDFDRIVMPIPYGHDHFLNLAGSILKPNGVIHFYTFKKDFEIAHFKRLLEEKGWLIDFFRECGDVAPRVSRYVFDLRKR